MLALSPTRCYLSWCGAMAPAAGCPPFMYKEMTMEAKKRVCPDCSGENDFNLDRRTFLKAVGVSAAVTAGGLPLFATPKLHAAPTRNSPAETAVKVLFDKLTDDQKKKV